MPYKAVGKNVMVKKHGKWRLLKKHKTVEEARKHALALTINVHHKG